MIFALLLIELQTFAGDRDFEDHLGLRVTPFLVTGTNPDFNSPIRQFALGVNVHAYPDVLALYPINIECNTYIYAAKKVDLNGSRHQRRRMQDIHWNQPYAYDSKLVSTLTWCYNHYQLCPYDRSVPMNQQQRDEYLDYLAIVTNHARYPAYGYDQLLIYQEFITHPQHRSYITSHNAWVHIPAATSLNYNVPASSPFYGVSDLSIQRTNQFGSHGAFPGSIAHTTTTSTTTVAAPTPLFATGPSASTAPASSTGPKLV